MRVVTKMFGEEGGKVAVPLLIYRLRDDVTAELIKKLRLIGVSGVELVVTTSNFFPSVQLGVVTTFSDAIPELLKHERNEWLNDIVKPTMMRFGIQKISVLFTDDEKDELVHYWKYLETGDVKEMDKVKYRNLQIAKRVDPTGETVDLAPPTTSEAQAIGQEIKV